MVAMVPLFWLVLAEEGRRQSDIFFLWLFGKPTISLPFDLLHPSLTPADVVLKLPDVALTCSALATDFGDRVCQSPIAAFNSVPANHAAFFFAGEQLRAVKLNYQRSYHTYLIGRLLAALGEPVAMLPLHWHAGGGRILLAGRELQADDEPALLWLAATPTE